MTIPKIRKAVRKPAPDYENDPEFTDEVLAERHRRLRGSDALRYFDPEDACTAQCGWHDNQLAELSHIVNGKVVGTIVYSKPTEHQCYSAPNHSGLCKFSSECRYMYLKEVPHGAIEKVDVVRAS